MENTTIAQCLVCNMRIRSGRTADLSNFIKASHIHLVPVRNWTKSEIVRYEAQWRSESFEQLKSDEKTQTTPNAYTQKFVPLPMHKQREAWTKYVALRHHVFDVGHDQPWIWKAVK